MALFTFVFNLPYAISVLLASVILYAVLRNIQSSRKLSHIPGPPFTGFSRVWMFWQCINTRLPQAQHDAIVKYGKTCRIGQDMLVTGDPELLRRISAPGSPWRRSSWYSSMRLDPRIDTVFSTRDEGEHARLKAKEAGGYNGREIDTLESDMDDRIVELIRLIEYEYHDKPINISDVSKYFTLDVISTLAFGGKKFGFMAANQDLYDYEKIGSGVVLYLFDMRLNFLLGRWLFSTKLMQALTTPGVRDSKGLGPMLLHTRQAVAERFGPDAKIRNDMLGHFVSKGLGQTRCEAEAFLQILAGTDSTSAILRLAVYSIAADYPTYRDLRAEIDGMVMRTGSEESTIVKHSNVQKLPCVNACIYETIRCFPPLRGLRSKIAPPGGETVGEIFIPAGTEVAISDDALCRDRSIFGQDADVFRPSRWIGLDEQTYQKRHRTVDFVWGTGRFACLGRHIGMMELSKTIFELFRRFEWTLVDPIAGVKTRSHAVRVQPHMMMYARPRTKA